MISKSNKKYFLKFLLVLSIFFSILQKLFSTNLSFLCPANPTSDKLDCEIEIGDYSSQSQTQKIQSNLIIIEYNIDRNAFGGDSPYEQGLENIISLMNGENSPLPLPDVLIMSELARDCKEYGMYIDGPRDLAQKLKLFYAYVVEYVEFEDETDHQCTIGNALFSKYPFQNVSQLRFESQCCKFAGRWGGRIAVLGDLIINEKIVTFYSTHLESGQGDVVDIVKSLVIRVEQVREMITNVKTNKKNSNNIIISGDFNAPFGDLDIVSIEMLINGYHDSHASLDYFDRDTCPFDVLSQFGIFIFDYIWVKGESFQFINPIICNLNYSKKCYGSSDHSPIMVTLSLN